MQSDKEIPSRRRTWLLPLLFLLAVPTLVRAGQKHGSAPRTSAVARPAARPATTRRPGTAPRRPVAGARTNRAVMRRGAPNTMRRAGPMRRTGGFAPARRTTRSVSLPGGRFGTVSRRPNGRVATIRTRGMEIHHPLRGPRRVEVERNGRTIVAYGRRGGYVQRPYLMRGGRRYFQRTYVVNGRSRVVMYRSYTYRGAVYYGYAPTYYYQPAYYGWAYNPWPAPVYYGPAAWGWAGSPWYAYYGPYFTPYPVYPTASLWLTDYLIAANLQAAYAAQAEANAAAQASASSAAAPAPLSPQVKQMIADEVKAQLAAEQAAAADPSQAPDSAQEPGALNPTVRVFIVSSSLDVTNASGEECALTGGDVLMRMTDSPDENQNLTARVMSSKQADCEAGQTVAIGVQNLQAMYNQFVQQVDSGLKTLASNSGTGGLPKAPDTSTTAGEVPQPTADSSAAAQLTSASQAADQADAAAQQ